MKHKMRQKQTHRRTNRHIILTSRPFQAQGTSPTEVRCPGDAAEERQQTHRVPELRSRDARDPELKSLRDLKRQSVLFLFLNSQRCKYFCIYTKLT